MIPHTEIIVLDPNTWEYNSDMGCHYYYIDSIENIDTFSVVEIGVSETLDDREFKTTQDSFKSADISRIKKTKGMVTLVSFGTKPQIPLTVDVKLY